VALVKVTPVLPPMNVHTKPAFFGQTLNFSGRSEQPKMKKNMFFVFVK